MAYSDKPMKFYYQNINGRPTPVYYPQYWSEELNDWVVSSEENRLPVDARLTGSIVEDNVIRTKTSVTLLESVEVTAGSTHSTDYIVPPKKYVVPMIRWESRTDFDVQIEFNAKGTNDYVQDRKTVYEEVNHVRQSELKKVECLSPKIRIRVSNTGDADTHIATIDAVYLD